MKNLRTAALAAAALSAMGPMPDLPRATPPKGWGRYGWKKQSRKFVCHGPSARERERIARRAAR